MIRKSRIEFDIEKEEPALRKSICTGEMTVGFLGRATGKFRDVALVTSPKEIEDFKKRTGTDKLREVY